MSAALFFHGCSFGFFNSGRGKETVVSEASDAADQETEVAISGSSGAADQETEVIISGSSGAADQETEVIVSGSSGEKADTEKESGSAPEDLSGEETSEGSAGDAEFIFPEYAGELFAVLNDNIPDFTEEELSSFEGENYSPLDSLGRCGPAMALLDRSMMPEEERGEIGEIRPSGWNQAKYPGIVDSEPPYLYNRCHLIAYALTGQNANEKNLITGTHYMNVEGMFPFEGQVLSYLYRSNDRVLYRVTPRFCGDELVARGVEMEAYSVGDGGAGVCFHVFVFNVQPGIEINYTNGESRQADI